VKRNENVLQTATNLNKNIKSLKHNIFIFYSIIQPCQVTYSPYLKVTELECHTLGTYVMWQALPVGSEFVS